VLWRIWLNSLWNQAYLCSSRWGAEWHREAELVKAGRGLTDEAAQSFKAAINCPQSHGQQHGLKAHKYQSSAWWAGCGVQVDAEGGQRIYHHQSWGRGQLQDQFEVEKRERAVSDPQRIDWIGRTGRQEDAFNELWMHPSAHGMLKYNRHLNLCL